jgi:phage terminase large subunit-like protein
VGVSRHPLRRDGVAVRLVRVLDPRELGRVDLEAAEHVIRDLCEQHVVAQVAYDVYQMKLLADRLTNDRVVWCKEFSQQNDRLLADRQLYDLILTRRIAHDGHQTLREHVLNAGARASKDGSSIRLQKLHPARKIDACVALSMASSRCLRLML